MLFSPRRCHTYCYSSNDLGSRANWPEETRKGFVEGKSSDDDTPYNPHVGLLKVVGKRNTSQEELLLDWCDQPSKERIESDGSVAPPVN